MKMEMKVARDENLFSAVVIFEPFSGNLHWMFSEALEEKLSGSCNCCFLEPRRKFGINGLGTRHVYPRRPERKILPVITWEMGVQFSVDNGSFSPQISPRYKSEKCGRRPLSTARGSGRERGRDIHSTADIALQSLPCFLHAEEPCSHPE